jgi:hypothetical protein
MNVQQIMVPTSATSTATGTFSPSYSVPDAFVVVPDTILECEYRWYLTDAGELKVTMADGSDLG